MKTLWQYGRPYLKQFILGPVFKLVEAVFELFLPLLMARLIDQGIRKDNLTVVWQMGGLMLLTSVIGLASVLVCQYFASVASTGFGTNLRTALYKKINELSKNELDLFGTSTLITRMTSDINLWQNAVAMFIRLVIRAPFLSIGAIIMAGLIQPQMIGIFILVLPVFSLLVYLIMFKTVPLFNKVQEYIDGFNLQVNESLSGVRVIRAFAQRKKVQKQVDQASDDLAGAYQRVANISALMNPLTTLLLNLGMLVILTLGGREVYFGSLTQGDVLALINYMTLMLTALTVVANLVVIFTRAGASGRRIAEVLNAPITVQDPITAKPLPDTGDLSLKHVSFRFNSENKNSLALQDIEFTLKPHQWFGITGPTGSGKTTLLALMLRYYDPLSGSITYGDHALSEYDTAVLRAMIGYVPQKNVLFSGTVADNLRFGNETATESQMWEALEIAQASQFIKPLPKQLDAPVTAGGTNFSGGQRQRLTIARALIKQPRILLLDDALSALDYETDLNLRTAIHQALPETTKVIVSQRLSSIKDSDQILVLDNGQQVGLGNHAELMKTSKFYQEIVQTQVNNQGGV